MRPIKFITFIKKLEKEVSEMDRHVDDLTEHREQFRLENMTDVKDIRIKAGLLYRLKGLARTIDRLLSEVDNLNPKS